MFEFIWKSCTHDKITANMISGYCPDCGEYIENHWYISRCKCCGVKQKATVKREKVATSEKFCRNCGCSEFVVEELDCLDVSNLDYAVVMKQTSETKRPSLFETWIENGNYAPIKLLPSY